MLNDPTISNQNQGTSERRASVRRDLSTEVVIRWHFDPSTAVRYQTADMSATGVRLQSAMPLLEGMTGALHAVVPSEVLNDGNVMVAWSRPSKGSHGYDVGIRFF